jgi:catechol 2,3-dioxygenase-like lactoylglutathione lyase family enzyme
MLAQSRSLFHRQEDVPDDTLLERVRSRLRHVVKHPQSTSTAVEAGIVRLTGTVAREEKKRVLKEIRDVPGVLKVEELLIYENRQDGRSIAKLLGGVAGAAVLLAVASCRSHSVSRALPPEASVTPNGSVEQFGRRTRVCQRQNRRNQCSLSSKGGQEVQSPQPEKSKRPVKMEQHGRILGIGGVFFKSANRDQMREWYSKHLGLADKGQGVMLPWREHDDPQKEHVTVWTVFPTSTDYFDPSHAPFMVNYIVDDLDALLDRLKQEGVKIDAKRMNESYGRFAWIYDLDGNKIELWQPSAKP